MGQAATSYFGQITYEEQAVVLFEKGVPGFETHKHFLILEQAASHPLVFLQSLTPGGPCFTTIPVHLIRPDYRLELSAEDKCYFQLEDGASPSERLLCLGVLSVDEEGWTVNLLAPIAIDPARRIGLQGIHTEDRYSHRETVFPGASC